MDKFSSFQEFLAAGSTPVSAAAFIINLIAGTCMALILSWHYNRFGRSLSERSLLSGNFLMITLTTLFIITVVKSSLALSLGLVGALSIVRFRTAIKEPEELAYLFFAIAIGLGLGANQIKLTAAAFVFIIIMAPLKDIFRRGKGGENLVLTIRTEKDPHFSLQSITDILSRFCRYIDLKRMDSSPEFSEAVIFAEFKSAENVSGAVKDLKDKFPGINISVLDNKGAF